MGLLPSPAEAILSGIPSSIDFGYVQVSQSSVYTITMTNTHSEVLDDTDVELMAIGLTGADTNDYYVVDYCAYSTLRPDESCSLYVFFMPIDTVDDFKSADLFIQTSEGTFTVSLFGVAVGTSGSIISVSTTSIDFGQVYSGVVGSQSITLTNSGQGSCEISTSSTNPSVFDCTNTCSPLAGGQTCSLTIYFMPSDERSYSETLFISWTGVNSGNTNVSLFGEGLLSSGGEEDHHHDQGAGDGGGCFVSASVNDSRWYNFFFLSFSSYSKILRTVKNH